MCASELTKQPAMRQHADFKELASTFGERIHIDSVGPAKQIVSSEANAAMATRGETTGYPSVRLLRSKTSDATAAAWEEMYRGVPQTTDTRCPHSHGVPSMNEAASCAS